MKQPLFYLFILFTFQVTTSLIAQEEQKPITIGFETEIKSEILGETRPILIHLPNDYEKSDRSYSVIYLLDGWGHFHHTTGTMQFLSRNGRMPKMIVVGIPNTKDRTHDLTPETSQKENFPTAGGADNLLDFMEKELFPFIEEKYRTTAHRTLIGHSFGGLFTVHALVNKSALFDAYLAISPSLWWDDQLLVDQAETFFKETPDLKKKLYMTIGNEGGDMLGGNWKLAAVLEESAPKDLDWQFHRMEKETHGSVPHRSTYDGFEVMFEDYQLKTFGLDLYNEGKLEAVQAHYDRLHEVYGDPKMEIPERTFVELGYRLTEKERFNDAVEVFMVAQEKYPKSSIIQSELGFAYKKKGEKDLAIQHYKKSLEINPGNQDAIADLKELGVNYEEKTIKLSAKLLDTYVGEYEAGPGMILYVTREGDKLFGQPTGESKLQLIPMEKNKFYLREGSIIATFSATEGKTIDTITVEIEGQDTMVGKRIK